MQKKSNQKTLANSKAGFVKMVRSNKYPEPRIAEVHADEVKSYKAYGWKLA